MCCGFHMKILPSPPMMLCDMARVSTVQYIRGGAFSKISIQWHICQTHPMTTHHGHRQEREPCLSPPGWKWLRSAVWNYFPWKGGQLKEESRILGVVRGGWCSWNRARGKIFFFLRGRICHREKNHAAEAAWRGRWRNTYIWLDRECTRRSYQYVNRRRVMPLSYFGYPGLFLFSPPALICIVSWQAWRSICT